MSPGSLHFQDLLFLRPTTCQAPLAVCLLFSQGHPALSQPRKRTVLPQGAATVWKCVLVWGTQAADGSGGCPEQGLVLGLPQQLKGNGDILS